MRRFGLLIALVLAGSVAAAHAALQLTNITGSFHTRLNAATFDGSSRFLAVGDNSTTLVGTFTGDHISWQPGSLPAGGINLGAAGYGSGVFLAGAVNSRVYRSVNGLSWTDAGAPFPNTPYVMAISFSPGSSHFATVASAKAISYAGTSLGWTAAGLSGGSFLESYRGVTAFGANSFAACGIRGNIRVSVDGGLNWAVSRSWSSGNPDLFGIASDGAAKLVAVGTNGTVVVTSNSGGVWSQSAVTSATLNAIGFSGSEFVAAGNGGAVMVSPTGTGSWSALGSGTANNLRGIAFGVSGPLEGVGLVVGDNGTIVLAGTPPAAPTSAVNQINCSYAPPNPALSVTIVPDTTHPAGTVTVDWYDAQGNQVTNNTTSFYPLDTVAPINAPTNYSYFARARDLRTGFVSDTDTEVVLTLNPRPTAAVSGSTVICNGDAAPFVTAALTGQGPWDVTWFDGVNTIVHTGVGGNGITGTDTLAGSTSATTIYQVIAVTDTPLSGPRCSARLADLSGEATVTVNPRPTAVVSGSTVVCNGDTAPIITAALAGQGPWDVTWFDGVNTVVHTGVGGAGTTGTDTLAGSTSATTTYQVIALTDTPLAGPRCSARVTDLSGQATVTVNPRPTATVTGSTVICSGDAAPVVTAALTGHGPWDVTWFDGANTVVHTGVGGSGTAGTDTLAGSTNATTTYKVIALVDTPSAGPRCSARPADLSGEAVITVNPRPTATVTGSTVICSGDAAPTVTAALTGHGPWDVTWFDGVNTVAHTGVGGSGTAGTDTLAAGTNTTATYKVIALVDTPPSGPRCSAWVTDLIGEATVSVNPRPTAVVSGSTVICDGDVAPTVTAALTGHGPWDVTWFDGVNTFIHTGVGGNGTTGSDTLAGSTNTTTTYTVIALTDTPLAGPRCSALSSGLTGQATVTVNPRPTAAVSGSTVICEGDPAPSLTVALTGHGPWDVTWFDGANTVIHTGVGGNGTTGTDTLTGSNTATTTYRVTALTDTPPAGPRCSARATDLTGQATVTVNARPSAPTGPVSQVGCFGVTNPPLSVTLPNNTYANWYTVESGGPPVYSGAAVFNPSTPGAGTNRYYVATVDAVTGCESTNRTEVDLILETCTTNLSIVLIDTNVVVSWYGNYVLESSTNLTPSYWSFAWLGAGGTNNWFTNLVVPPNNLFYRLYAPTN